MACNNQLPGYQRKKLHKNNSHSKIDFREQFRKNCYDRIKSQQSKTYQNLLCAEPIHIPNNQVIKTIISEELTKFKPNDEIYSDSPDFFNELAEEMQRDFTQENDDVDDSEFIDHLTDMMISPLPDKTSLFCLCPICKCNFLSETEQQQTITCSCGLVLESDVFPLSYIKQRLNEVISSHSQCCKGGLEFSTQQLPAFCTTALFVKCNLCQASEFVL